MSHVSAKACVVFQQRTYWKRVVALVSMAICILLLPVTANAATDSDLPDQKTVVLFGANIRYYDVGSGPVIVLVHGLGSSAKGDWGNVIIPLSQTHRVLALDQLGFGNSDKPLIDFGIQTWVDFLGEFLRQQQVTDFTLVGESLGGWISAQYTIQALKGVAAGPTLTLPKPAKLVLVDSAGLYASMKQQFTAIKSRSKGKKAVVSASLEGEKWLLSNVFHGDSYHTDQALRDGLAWSLTKGDAWTIRTIYNPALLNETVDNKLHAITIPTLVIWGQYDTLFSLKDARYFVSKIKGSKLKVIPDSGHAPMLEAPNAFLSALQPFLSLNP